MKKEYQRISKGHDVRRKKCGHTGTKMRRALSVCGWWHASYMF